MSRLLQWSSKWSAGGLRRSGRARRRAGFADIPFGRGEPRPSVAGTSAREIRRRPTLPGAGGGCPIYPWAEQGAPCLSAPDLSACVGKRTWTKRLEGKCFLPERSLSLVAQAAKVIGVLH